MRIRIKSNGHNIVIPFPTGLIFSRPSVWLWMKIAGKAMKSADRISAWDASDQNDSWFTKLPEEVVYALCDELMRIKRKYGHWDLVEVSSGDGEFVQIRL